MSPDDFIQRYANNFSNALQSMMQASSQALEKNQALIQDMGPTAKDMRNELSERSSALAELGKYSKDMNRKILNQVPDREKSLVADAIPSQAPIGPLIK